MGGYDGEGRQKPDRRNLEVHEKEIGIGHHHWKDLSQRMM